MVSRSNQPRKTSRMNGADYQMAYDKALSYDFSDLVYITPRFKKFLELKGVQFRVR